MNRTKLKKIRLRARQIWEKQGRPLSRLIRRSDGSLFWTGYQRIYRDLKRGRIER